MPPLSFPSYEAPSNLSRHETGLQIETLFLNHSAFVLACPARTYFLSTVANCLCQSVGDQIGSVILLLVANMFFIWYRLT